MESCDLGDEGVGVVHRAGGGDDRVGERIVGDRGVGTETTDARCLPSVPVGYFAPNIFSCIDRPFLGQQA